MAGIIVVRHGPLTRDQATEYTLREIWRVGGVDVPDEEAFSGPFMVAAFAPNGQAVVLDQTQSNVSVFDGASGAFVRKVGRPGQGPGELLDPAAMAWGPAHRLWVANSFDGRYTLYDSAGAFLKTVRRPAHSTNRRVFPIAFSPSGMLVDHVGGYPDVRVLRVDTLGIARDTVRIRQPPQDMFGDRLIRPGSALQEVVWLRPRLQWAFAPGGESVWITRTDSLTLVQLSLAGDTLRRVETSHRTARFTAAQRDAVRRANRELGRDGGFAPVLVQALHVMDDGRLLVQIGQDMTEPGREMDVFAPDGVFLGTLRTPFAVHHRSVLASRGDTLLVPAVGEYDVPLLIKAVVQRAN